MSQDSCHERFLRSIENCFRNIIVLLLCIPITVFVIPLLLLGFILFGCLRQGVIFLAKCFGGEELLSPLSLGSNPMANLDHIYNNKAAFTMVYSLILEMGDGEGGSFDIERVRDGIWKRFQKQKDPHTNQPLYKELTYGLKYWCGYPFWTQLKKTEEKLLKDCVSLYDEDSAPVNFHQLQEIVKTLACQEWEEGAPLIQLVFLPHYIPNPSKEHYLDPSKKHMVAILRLHHALCDGFSVKNVMKNIASFQTPADHFEHLQTGIAKQAFTNGILKGMVLPFAMIYDSASCFYDSCLYTTQGSLWPRNLQFRNAPWDKEELQQNLKLGVLKIFTLDDLRRARSLHAVSTTAVIYSSIVGALRKTMFQGNRMPGRVCLALPLPTRRTTEGLVNDSASTAFFPTLNESDPAKRVQMMEQELHRLKKSSTLHIASTLLGTYLGGMMPGPLFRLVNSDRNTREMIVLSNVPGPLKEVDFCGFPQRGVYFMTGFNARMNVPLFTILSYMGQLQLCVIGGSHLFPSQDKLEDFERAFFKELDDLKKTSPKEEEVGLEEVETFL